MDPLEDRTVEERGRKGKQPTFRRGFKPDTEYVHRFHPVWGTL
jgi:hypothetical protein